MVTRGRVGLSQGMTVKGAAAAGSSGARIHMSALSTLQLSGNLGYVWDVVDWDDNNYVTTGHSLLNASATCFEIPAAGRYEIAFGLITGFDHAYPTDVPKNQAVINVWSTVVAQNNNTTAWPPEIRWDVSPLILRVGVDYGFHVETYAAGTKLGLWTSVCAAGTAHDALGRDSWMSIKRIA